MADELTGRLVEVLRRHLRGASTGRPLAMETSLVDLGLDSLSAMNVLLDLEDCLGVRIPESMVNAGTFSTVATLREAVGSLTEGSR